MNGKGDSPRPMSVSYEEYEKNWKRTFGKKEIIIRNEEVENPNDLKWIDDERKD